MKTYTYVEPGDDGVTPVVVTLTEDEIIDRYWKYWSNAMEKIGKHSEINRENCIEDFCIVNWAVED